MTVHIADELLDAEGRIQPDAWAMHRTEGLAVGTCHCGAEALADRDDVAWGRRSFAVICARGEHEAAIPATRVVRAPTVWVGPVGLDDAILDAARERDAAILGERVSEPV